VLAAGAAARTEQYAYWRISISGMQTMRWEWTSRFNTKPDTDPSITCDIRHRGDQTIRWQTPGPVRVRLTPTSSETVLYSFLRGKWRNIVPLVGIEHRVHRVLEAPPGLSVCADRWAKPAATNCEGTKPLVKGTAMLATVLPTRGPPQVEMHVPAQFALQPSFPSCNSLEFDIDNYFVYPLFTYGAQVKLHGGSFTNPATKRLSGQFVSGKGCLSEAGFPQTGHFTSCSKPHVAEIVVNYRVDFSR
jgi:hypothetical protein